MNIKPFVSITVPIYNAEKDLSRCVESLINQTLQDIEIILVNDGSTDLTGELCNKYALQDKRIKVFHQQNQGSASARQLGLENSIGEYYTVCDSDDWVEPNMYEDLYKKARSEDTDMILSRHFINYPNGKQIMSPSYRFINQEKYILDLMRHKTSVNTWNKLIKLKTIRQYNVTYEQGINLGEDALFLYKILLNPVKITSVENCYYHYQRNMNSNSYTNNLSIDTLIQSEFVTNWRIQNYCDLKYKKYNERSKLGLAFLALRTNNVNDNDFNRLLNQISLKHMYLYNMFSLKTYLMIATKLLGKNFGLFLFRKFYKLVYR